MKRQTLYKNPGLALNRGVQIDSLNITRLMLIDGDDDVMMMVMTMVMTMIMMTVISLLSMLVVIAMFLYI